MGGSNATCVSLGPEKAGGLTIACRECSRSGYQPFKGASALEFWIRDQNGSSTIPDVQARSLPRKLGKRMALSENHWLCSLRFGDQ